MKGDNFRKLSDEDTAYIRRRGLAGACMAGLARRFKISRQRVWQIVRR